jgi:hypothetical protein
VPQGELGVDLPQESSRFLDLLSPASLGRFPYVQGGDGVDRGLTKAAGIGRRGRGVGRSRRARLVVWAWEVAVRRGLGIEDYMGHLPGPPLVLEEGKKFPRGATGVEMGEPDSDERGIPAPLVWVEVGGAQVQSPMSFRRKTCLARAANRDSVPLAVSAYSMRSLSKIIFLGSLLNRC